MSKHVEMVAFSDFKTEDNEVSQAGKPWAVSIRIRDLELVGPRR